MRKLLFSVTPDDCKLQTFTVGGNGGSGKDTSNTGVRWIHEPSGAVGEARDERSQLANKRLAWKRMASSKEFKTWARVQASKYSDINIDSIVDRLMEDHNLLVETQVNGKWQKLV